MKEVLCKIDEAFDNAGRQLYSNRLLVKAQEKFEEAKKSHVAEIQRLQSKTIRMKAERNDATLSNVHYLKRL